MGINLSKRIKIRQFLRIVFILLGFIGTGFLLIFGLLLLKENMVNTNLERGSIYSPIPVGAVSGTNAKTKDPPYINKNIESFYLTIPKLGIKMARVIVNVPSSDTDKEKYFKVLEESIAHFKGSALPGQEGNVFLYGHSVLPWFFDPERYTTIFSTLPEIELGDQILIDAYGRTFTYEVVKKEIVAPDDMGVFLRSKNSGHKKTLSLMTCVPPGLETQRLVVTARQTDPL